MAILHTGIDPESDAGRANAAGHAGLVDELRAKLAQAALGGPEASRERHVATVNCLQFEALWSRLGDECLDCGSHILHVSQELREARVITNQIGDVAHLRNLRDTL